MTLRPVRSSRKGYRNRKARLAQKYAWKPWKGWNPNRTFNGTFDPRAAIKLSSAFLILLSIFLTLDYGFGGPFFHSYSTTPALQGTDFSALAVSCQQFHVPSTCATVAQGSMDPTYPITKYSAATNSLAEFNTAGNIVYTGSCGPIGATKCMNLTATKAPPPLAVQFNMPGVTLKLKDGTVLIPITLSTVYRKVATFSSNGSYLFDVSGVNHAQTGTYQITTFSTITVIFLGQQPSTVTCSFCSSTSFGTGPNREILTIPPGITNGQFTLTWTGSNLLCLCAIAESVNPIGDLSPVVSKELEFSLYWQNTTNLPGCSQGQNCSFGWFLTTNSTTWKTNNSTWTPFNDPSVALVVELYSTGTFYETNIWIQHNPRDTMQQENSGGCVNGGGGTGSEYACAGAVGVASTPNVAYMDLNFTGGSTGAQVGNTVNCPNLPPSRGGPGCSYVLSFNGVGVSGGSGFNVQLPNLAISGTTYYSGFWVGNGELKSPLLFCFDTGATCSAQQTWIVAGCVSASMEIDSCVPNPTSTNGVNSVTDSGGFFGSVWHTLTSIGSGIASFTQPIWGPALNAVTSIGGSFLNDVLGALEAVGSYMINTAFPALEAILATVLNTIGNLIWPNSNIGTLLFGFLGDVVTLLTNTVYGIPAFFANFPLFFSQFVSWLQIVFPFLSPMFTIAAAVLAFGLAMVSTGIAIFTTGTQLILFSYGFVLMFSFIVFVGDDGIGGVLTYLGTAEALAFKILNIVAVMTNLGLDLLVTVISLIPKPFVQMNAGRIPRLPILETRTSITFPRFDFAELRSGNMTSAWLLMVGFYLDVFYESANPSLPGSLASLVPATASAMQNLSNLLPMFKIFVFISGGLVLFYLVMMPVQRLGVDLGVFEEFGVGLGGRQGPGPSGVSVNFSPKKHLAGPAKKIAAEQGLASVEVAGKGSGGFVVAGASSSEPSPESTEA